MWSMWPKMLTLAGAPPEQAAKEAAAVLEIETALAKGSTSRTDLREPENRYHIYTVADFQKLTPEFDYSLYFKAVKFAPLKPSTLPRPTSSRRSTSRWPNSRWTPGRPTSAGI